MSYAYVVMAVITIASAYYQQVQAKKAANKAEGAAIAAAEAAKGFKVVHENSSATLPLVYGRSLVGGARVFADVRDSVSLPTGPGQNFTKGFSGARVSVQTGQSSKGKKRYGYAPGSYLLTQQAVALSGINGAVTVDVNQKPWDDSSYNFGQYITFFRDSGLADPLITANASARKDARFAGACFGSAIFKLDRDDPQYQGVPEVLYYLEGMRVHSIVNAQGGYALSATRAYSNNPALCLLDFLMNPSYGRGLELSDLDLKSFYIAARICGEIVMSDVGKEGRFWKAKPAGEPRNISRYELNCAFDTGAPVRDTIDVILKSMGDADLIWSAGKFRLNLSYPQLSLPEGGAYEGLVVQTGEGADTRLYECIVNFTMTLPGDNPNWKRIDHVLTEDHLFLDENFVQIWPTAQDRYNHCKVTFSNEAYDFAEDTAEWPPKMGLIDGPRLDRGEWVANRPYDTSDFVTHGGVRYQLTKGNSYISATPPPSDPTWSINPGNSVYETYLKEDNGIPLETTEALAFTTDYYHALAYAENVVRLSRANVSFSISVSLDLWGLEPGDFVNLQAPSLGVPGELARVEAIEVMDSGFLKIDLTKFDARNLAWNAKDDEVVTQRNIYNTSLGQAIDVRWSPEFAPGTGRVGNLSWLPPATDGRVEYYRIKYSVVPVELVDETTVWTDLGQTTNLSFDIERIPTGFYTLAVVACSGSVQAPKYNPISDSQWPTVSVGIGAYTDGNTTIFYAAIYKVSETLPATPEGGSFDFATLSFPTLPAGWSLSPPLSAAQLWRAEATIYAGEPTIDWSLPVETSNTGTYTHIDRGVLVVKQNELGANVGYTDAVTNIHAYLANVDVTNQPDTIFEAIDPVNCTFVIDTGPNKGRIRVTSLSGDGGAGTVKITYGGAVVYKTFLITVFKLGYQVDNTPPPEPTGLTVEATFSTVFLHLANQPAYSEGHGHASTVVYGAKLAEDGFAEATQRYEFSGMMANIPHTPSSSLFLWFTNKSRDGYESAPYGKIDASTGRLTVDMLDPALKLSVTSLSLSASSMVVRLDQDGHLPTGSSQDVSLLATTSNTSEPVVWTAVGTLPNGAAEPVALSSVAGARVLLAADAARFANVAIRAESGTVFDTITVVTLKSGSDALSVVVSNENVSVLADSEGVVSSYAPTSGLMRLFRGTELVPHTDIEYSVWNFSRGTATIDATGAYAVTSMLDDSVSITLRAYYKTSVIVEKVLTVTKVKPGPRGADGVRGSLRRYASDPSYVAWSDALANDLVGGVPLKGDEVTISDGASFITMREFDGVFWTLPGQVIDGSLLVTGTVAADAIQANSITTAKIAATGLTADVISTGTLRAGADIYAGNRLRISADGYIETYSADGYSRASSYSRLDNGNVQIFKYIPALGTVKLYNMLTRAEAGVAYNNTPVTIPGYWTSQPRIIVSPHSLQLYSAAYATQDQKLDCQATNIVQTGAGSMVWQFLPVATLSLAATSTSVVINESQSSPDATWLSSEYLTVANTARVDVAVSVTSMRGTGLAGQFYRRYVNWTIQYYNGGWVDLISTYVDIGAQQGYVASSNGGHLPSAGPWRLRIVYSAGDAGGTYTTSGAAYETAQDLVIVSKTAPGNYGVVINNNDSPFKGYKVFTVPIDGYALPASDNGHAWSITSTRIKYDYAYYQEVIAQSDPSSQTAARSTITAKGVSHNLTTPVRNTIYRAGSSSMNNFAAVDTTINSASYPANLGTLEASVTTNANGSIKGNAATYFTYRNMSVWVNRRRLVANSTAPTSASVFSSYQATLASSTILATGSLNWVAIGD